MKIFKCSSIILLSMFFMWAFMPQAEAKHCKRYSNCKSKCRSSFSLNFNVNPQPCYVAPLPVYESVTYVAQPPLVAQQVYYPAYQQQVIVQRPCAQQVFVRPGFSYSYWRY